MLSADIYDAPAVEGFFSALAKVDRARGAGPGGLQQHQHLLKDDDPSASSSSDPCWQPASSVLVTVANFHHVGLALMQFRHLSERRTGGCSLTRAVVAVDTFVSDLCGDMGFRWVAGAERCCCCCCPPARAAVAAAASRARLLLLLLLLFILLRRFVRRGGRGGVLSFAAAVPLCLFWTELL